MALAPTSPAWEDVAARERGAQLRKLQLFDSSRDADFDNLVALATAICGKPMGAMTLLDEKTLLIKAQTGLSGASSIPLEQSMCQYTVQGTELLIVEDVETNPALAPMRQQLALAGMRFYAGMPLFNDAGIALGALCVMDVEPTTLTADQQHALRVLGQQVSRLMQLRKHVLAVEHLAVELERTQKMLGTILDAVPVGIYLKDDKGRLRFYNQSIADHFRVDRQAWMGKTSFDLWDEATARELDREDTAVMQAGVAQESFITVPAPEGTPSHWRSHKVPCLNGDGEKMLACCSIDLTEQIQRETELQRAQDALEEANRKLSSLALTDALTGLWNRRAFNAQLETQIMASHRNGQPMSLMLVDVDHFKTVNDRFGHPYGDSVLREIAALLNRAKRGDDLACRFGGEEFAILLPGTDIKAARHLADRILKAMRTYQWEKSPVTVSIGVAMCKPECVSDEMIDEADAALYRAKRAGRDRVVLYTDAA